MADRFEFGADVITLVTCANHEPGQGSVRSAARVLVNGVHRAYLTFPLGYGGKWGVYPLNSPLDAHNTYVRKGPPSIAHFAKGEAGRRAAVEGMLNNLHQRFPVQIEWEMRKTADRNRRREQDVSRPPSFRTEASSAYSEKIMRRTADGLEAIAKREAAEEHLEAMRSIPVTGLSNRQAVAIADAARMAEQRLAALYDLAGETHRRSERAQIRRRMKEGRGVSAYEVPDGWPLIDEDD